MAVILRGAPLCSESERAFFAFFKLGCLKQTIEAQLIYCTLTQWIA
jgi:hypothetical protein